MTDDPTGELPEKAEEYRRKWNSYIADLERLELRLSDEQAEVLEDTIGQLERLVDAGAEQVAENIEGDR